MKENEEKTLAAGTTVNMLLVIMNASGKGALPANAYEVDIVEVKGSYSYVATVTPIMVIPIPTGKELFFRILRKADNYPCPLLEPDFIQGATPYGPERPARQQNITFAAISDTVFRTRCEQ
jgi:hypothetical protein